MIHSAVSKLLISDNLWSKDKNTRRKILLSEDEPVEAYRGLSRPILYPVHISSIACIDHVFIVQVVQNLQVVYRGEMD